MTSDNRPSRNQTAAQAVSIHPLLHPITHWTPGRKEALLDAVVRGELTSVDIEQAHGITTNELDEWARAFIVADKPGLRATKRVPSESHS